MKRALLLLVPALVAAACRPDFAERESLVTGVQVLAVRADPPEGKPGEAVTYTPFVVAPEGAIASPPASWAFCATPKLLTENGAVSRACLGDGVRPIGEGAVVTATTPSDACALFGPEVTSADLRPRDPDVTGGFYQPVRVTIDEGASPVVAFGASRLRCSLASVSVDVAAELDRRYRANENPEIAVIDGDVALDAVPAGAQVTLRVSWAPEAQEPYALVDPISREVVDRRESLRVSWHVTGGEVDHDRTGRTPEEREAFSENVWRAPAEPGTTHLFVVLRDDRGGVAFASRDLVVR